MKKSQTPDYYDLYPFSTHQGAISYRNQNFRYVYCEKNESKWLFVFDPQTDGMTLTNACDFVLEQIFQHLILAKFLNPITLKDLCTVGAVVLRDSDGEYAQVSVIATSAQNTNGDFIITGAKVKSWKHFDFSPEFFELFKLMG